MTLNFYGNPMMNDDPLSKMDEVAGLHTFANQVAEIGSNLLALLVVWSMYRVGNATVGAVSALMFVYSTLYHACQTADICLRMNLVITTMMDHVTAPTTAALVLMIAVMISTVTSMKRRHRLLLKQLVESDPRYQRVPFEPQIHGLSSPLQLDLFSPSTTTTTIATLMLGDIDEKAMPHDGWDRYKPHPDTSYYYTYLYKEENMMHDAWSVTVVIVLIVVAFNATLVHPFSTQSFLITIGFALAVVFFKVVVLDDGQTDLSLDTVSVPDVVIGVMLIAIGLVFFLLDSYFYYAIFHPLWHVFSFIGMFFYGMGVSKASPNFYSPFERIKRAFVRKRTSKQQAPSSQ
jgi:hypothetical protein